MTVAYAPEAETLPAAQCSAALTLYGGRFGCDNTRPHRMHTNAALKARWVDEDSL